MRAKVIEQTLVLLLLISKGYASMILSEEGISPARSAEYVRTQSRNATTESDAVHYNPAGLSFLQNGGIYIVANSVNTFTRKGETIDMWGLQGPNPFNSFISPLTSGYQSATRYLSSVMAAVPTDIAVIFKKDNWAVFASVSALRGQPGIVYIRGASFMDRMLVAYNTVLASYLSHQLAGVYTKSSFKREEFHLGATVGASYGFLDRLAASLSFRYINVKANTQLFQLPLAVILNDGSHANAYQSPASINTDVFGHGSGIIIGMHAQPHEKIHIGMRAEYYPPLILTKRTNRFIANPVLAQSGKLNLFCDSVIPLVMNDRLNAGGMGNIFNILLMDPNDRKQIGNRLKATYPPSLSMGISFRVHPSLKFDTSIDVTFPRARDLDGRERNWKTAGYRVGQAVEWNATTWLAVSAGYSYHDFGLRPEKVTEYDDLLSSHTVGAGASMKPLEFLTITTSGSYSFFQSAKRRMYDLLYSRIAGQQFTFMYGWGHKLSRDEWSVSLGVTFSFYPVTIDRMKKAEEHYWKGMSLYLSDDLDKAIEEFKTARSYNSYYRDVGKKIRELKELQELKKKVIQDEKEHKDEK